MSRSAHFRLMLVLTLTGAAACAGARGGPAALRAPIASGSIITETEIATSTGRTAYETIQRLRPLFLSTARAHGTSAHRPVYVDGVRAGGLDALRSIPTTSVREIRLFDAREATQRFGDGHSAGALAIATRTGR